MFHDLAIMAGLLHVFLLPTLVGLTPIGALHCYFAVLWPVMFGLVCGCLLIDTYTDNTHLPGTISVLPILLPVSSKPSVYLIIALSVFTSDIYIIAK